MPQENKGKRNVKESNDDMINLIDNLNRNEDLKLNRRSFLKSVVGASVALGLATVPFSAIALNNKKEDLNRQKIIKLKDLPKDSSIKFNYPTADEPAILVHTKDGNLKAYNNKCTHLQCPVFYDKEESKLLCPCHRGFFSVDNGQPLAGPPQRELPLIELEVVDGVVYAVGRKVRHGA
ncbi:(2Fe-2S)-binding protein [Bacillus sp. AFS077874]|uniref:QcrA and Rieske domain-containing protein n=1 Tax=Bacillus sp. AFS077874 TaxID=2033513 RepID=UPI000BF3E276|nr:Rieske 2Fe-2S domain-containing protein [Bacillus sp. AFS077874]PFM79969.1 (2Fe-2S)-binding protein [Bacillus sp. AFS077874]